MRHTLLVLFLSIVVTTEVRGQTLTMQEDQDVTQPTPFALQTGTGLRWPPPPPPRHCCNIKGALIGAAIGAASGALLMRALCDSSDCTRDYFKLMGAFGGLGAALGIYANAAPGYTPFPHRRVRVAGIVTPTMRGVVTTVPLGRHARID
ncbi:MAG TPA: hypothetical protein VGF24_19005 [Vicinamibacterales bacterium]